MSYDFLYPTLTSHYLFIALPGSPKESTENLMMLHGDETSRSESNEEGTYYRILYIQVGAKKNGTLPK